MHTLLRERRNDKRRKRYSDRFANSLRICDGDNPLEVNRRQPTTAAANGNICIAAALSATVASFLTHTELDCIDAECRLVRANPPGP